VQTGDGDDRFQICVVVVIVVVVVVVPRDVGDVSRAGEVGTRSPACEASALFTSQRRARGER
jgi:hypothetical protein